jgi:hypothetical protein
VTDGLPAASDSEQKSSRARYVLEALRERKTRLLVALIILTLIFVGLALIQHWFVQSQIYRTTSQELASGAEQIASEIAYADRWELKDYRNSISLPSEPPAWYIITRDGHIVDIAGFIPGFFGRVEPPEDRILKGGKTAAEETWHLLQTPVEGGYVILGIVSSKNTPNADAKLKDNAKEFGSTLAEATALALTEENSIKGRKIDNDVDFAVISSDGELKAAWGGVPLKTDMNALPAPSDHVKHAYYGGKPYLLYFRPIVDKQHQEIGTIIVPKDMSLEEQALHSQDLFNRWIVGITGALAIATMLVLMLKYELEKRSLEISLEEALKKGEGQSIEFKSGIIDSGVAKVIAAFANTNTGNIFVGVEDNGGVSGLREQTPHERDQLLRKIRQVATMIQPPVSPGATFLYYDGKTVLRVFVPKGAHPLYVLQGTVWIRRLAEVVAADRQEIIERALGARRVRVRPT